MMEFLKLFCCNTVAAEGTVDIATTVATPLKVMSSMASGKVKGTTLGGTALDCSAYVAYSLVALIRWSA